MQGLDHYGQQPAKGQGALPALWVVAPGALDARAGQVSELV